MSLSEWGDGEAGPKRAQWAFVVDFGEYAGNFPAEFAAWVIGRANEGMENRVKDILDHRRKHIADDEEMMNGLLSCRKDDYGYWSHYALAPTPGRRNNGMGEHGDASSGFKSPAYESVAFFLDREPTSTEQALLKHQMGNFPIAMKQLRPKTKYPKPLRCRLVKEVATLELIEVG